MSFLSVDYLNTLNFIRSVGGIGEAKSVYRNRLERIHGVTTEDVFLLSLYFPSKGE